MDALRDDPALGGAVDAELAQLDARGVEGFIAYLKSRADRADDLVDYGFIKVQTDVYRVRQLVLGTTAATRLAVSPALATIAQAETAVASQEQISTFFQNLVTATPSTRHATVERGASGSGQRPDHPRRPPASHQARSRRFPRRGASAVRRAPRQRGDARRRLFGSIGGSTLAATRPAFGAGSVLVGNAPLVSGPAFGGADGGLLTGGTLGGGVFTGGGLAGGRGTQIDVTPELGGIIAGDFGRSDAVRAITDLGLIGVSAGARPDHSCRATSSTPRRSSARRTSAPPPSRSGSQIRRPSKRRTTPPPPVMKPWRH